VKRGSSTMQVTCFVCHNDMDDRTGVRSLSWLGRIPGVRAILCSRDCRDKWDTENLSHPDEIMEDK
jgi:hypothetical protein